MTRKPLPRAHYANSKSSRVATAFPRYARPEVALFYAQWYQAQQVNIAYSNVRAALGAYGSSIWPTGGGRLHIIDYGSGALAVSFGIAFAVADRIAMKLPSPDITVTAIDYASMFEIGSQLWRRFELRVRGDNDLDHLQRALDGIEHRHVAPEKLETVILQSPTSRKRSHLVDRVSCCIREQSRCHCARARSTLHQVTTEHRDHHDAIW